MQNQNDKLYLSVCLLNKYIDKVVYAVDRVDHSALPSISQIQAIDDGLDCESDRKLFNRMLVFCVRVLETRFVDYFDSKGEMCSLGESLHRISKEEAKKNSRMMRFNRDAESKLKSSIQNIEAKNSLHDTLDSDFLIFKAEDECDELVSMFEKREKIRAYADHNFKLIHIEEPKLPHIPAIPIEFKGTIYENIAREIRAKVRTFKYDSRLGFEFKEYWKELCKLTGIAYQENYVAPKLMHYIKVEPIWIRKGPSGLAIADLYNRLVVKNYIEAHKCEEFISIFTGCYKNNKEPQIKWLWRQTKSGSAKTKNKNIFGRNPKLNSEESNITALHYLIYAMKDFDRFKQFFAGKIPNDEALDILGTGEIKIDRQQESILGDKPLLCKCFTHPNGELFDPRHFSVKRKVNKLVADEVLNIVLSVI